MARGRKPDPAIAERKAQKAIVIAERKAIRAAKKAENARRAQARKAETQAKRDERWRVFTKVAKSTIREMQQDNRDGLLSSYTEGIYARIIGNRLLHELDPVYSGFCSARALVMGYYSWLNGVKYSATLEHYNPSQVIGQRFVNAFKNASDIDDTIVNQLIDEALMVHKVHADENQWLREHQTTDVFVDGDTAYAAANIKLYPWPPRTPWSVAKKMYPELFVDI